ncbi:monooxygenase [Colletotrichum simmondsii]|uniref:Monooxygenase n=1 Tax=Colletotrichum simmondsii TaxID=703756 RepID=A0A135S0N7_9PEZI|nr:monooxygenase [Colletotrichum simmondsii]
MSIPEHLVEKYASERAKRLRSDQLAQFVDFRDPEFASMDKDPYVDYDAVASRGFPLEDGSEVKVLIAGAGMFGVMTAYQLVNKAGIASSDIVMVDKAGGFGGTWYWNRYPGVACDIEGYCYVPLLEETGYMPKHRYSYGHEIREHLERIASSSNIQGQFCTTIKNQKWDNESKRWVVTLKHDLGPGRAEEHLTVRAQFLVLGGGIQTSPHAPRLNGIDAFRSAPGKLVMHTGRWDWSKTGGSQDLPDMTKLQGKRVGIVGTGATAVQVVPHIAKWASHTFIFQRTPSYVGPQQQKETTPDDWARVAYKTGWQHERVANLDATFTGQPIVDDMIQDGWTQVTGMRAALGHEGKIITADEEEKHIQKMLNIDFPWTEQMRTRVDAEVKDHTVANKLKAWYPGFCKRPTFHSTYLSLFNKPEVSLVDTNGRGIEAYTPRGVIASGEEYELDVLILATGYTVGLADSCPSSALGSPLVGRGGQLLKEKWDGPDYGNLYGAMSNGFPNLFFASGSGGSVSQNANSFYSLLTRLIAHVLKSVSEQARDAKSITVEVEKNAEDHWSAEVARRARWFAAFPSCTPGYLTGEGLVQDQRGLTQEMKDQISKQPSWGEGILNFQKVVETWMRDGKLEGLMVNS